MSDTQNPQISRRDFLKVAGLVGAAVQAGSLVAGGVAEGSSSESYTGWESFNPGTQFFNRKPFEFDGPAHEPVGEVRRPSHITDYVFGRVAMFQKAYEANPDWTLDDPIEDLGVIPPVLAFYKEFPERLEWDYRTFSETIPTNKEDRGIYGDYYRLADAYSSGFSYHRPPKPDDIPEVTDFLSNGRELTPALPFKTPELASEFIKEIAHRFGATLVGITKTNIDWFYADSWGGTKDKDYDHSKLPDHWQFAIAIGVPMEWDVVLGSPNISTSYDAYDRVSTAAVRLEGALKSLGYPARASTPMTNYDLICPPVMVDAGLGEVCRAGFCVTPEVGSNCRAAVVVTSLPMAVDRPIDFGVADFCNKCKICADQCPSGAISKADNPDDLIIRGYNHWYINNGACYNFWRESMGPMGCRLCVANCPYSRKDNWLHSLARELDPRDPTGLVSSGLLWMQKSFFDHPDALDYKRPPEGSFATYRKEPVYLQAERFLDMEINNPNGGE